MEERKMLVKIQGGENALDEEYCILEFQGEMSGELAGGELGSLQVDSKSGSAEMKIGLLKLEGSVLNLKNPFLVVTKSMKTSDNGNGSGNVSGNDGNGNDMLIEEQGVAGGGQSKELDAIGIVRKKIIFQTRPIPLSIQPL